MSLYVELNCLWGKIFSEIISDLSLTSPVDNTIDIRIKTSPAVATIASEVFLRKTSTSSKQRHGVKRYYWISSGKWVVMKDCITVCADGVAGWQEIVCEVKPKIKLDHCLTHRLSISHCLNNELLKDTQIFIAWNNVTSI